MSGRSVMSSRKAWTDFMASAPVQPPLIPPEALPTQPKRRRRGSAKKPDPSETSLLSIIHEALKYHPKVARIERINVVAGKIMGKDGTAGRFIRSCKKGRSDLDGISRDGLTIAIEVKKPSTRKRLTIEQADYLRTVREAGGLAGVATSVEEAFAIVEGRNG